ncbi:hypothetical protein ARMSODRAFT_63345 [Armillaria solidipes]|uniref:Uncharacterized protein n=1 Tax=Armillaria solidipes TaxID=1076256 RepID=A0A2H3BN54_9AGAR|nr:hypothetical protein ARMSODRAFT_63345 [Armillaria solidipes]
MRGKLYQNGKETHERISISLISTSIGELFTVPLNSSGIDASRPSFASIVVWQASPGIWRAEQRNTGGRIVSRIVSYSHPPNIPKYSPILSPISFHSAPMRSILESPRPCARFPKPLFTSGLCIVIPQARSGCRLEGLNETAVMEVTATRMPGSQTAPGPKALLSSPIPPPTLLPWIALQVQDLPLNDFLRTQESSAVWGFFPRRHIGIPGKQQEIVNKVEAACR